MMQKELPMLGGSAYEPVRLAPSTALAKWTAHHEALTHAAETSRFSRSWFAEKMGAEKGTVSNWLNGRRPMNLPTLDRFMEQTRSLAPLQYLCKMHATEDFVRWLCGEFGGEFKADPLAAQEAEAKAALARIQAQRAQQQTEAA